MKAGTQNHLKVKRLKRLLGIPLYRAVGILETLWLLCVDCCDEGNIGKFTDDEIADYVEWDGSASELVQALADSGWTDRDPVHRYVVHDWLEHCPTYISDRVRKRTARKVKANEITTYVVSAADNAGKEGGLSQACPTLSENVPSIPILSQPNPSQPIQSQPAANAGGERKRTPRTKRHQFSVEQLKIPPPIDTPEVREALVEWLDYKLVRGEGYKRPRYLELKLAEFTEPEILVRAVHSSIGSNYAGLISTSPGSVKKAKTTHAVHDPSEATTTKDPTYGKL